MKVKAQVLLTLDVEADVEIMTSGELMPLNIGVITDSQTGLRCPISSFSDAVALEAAEQLIRAAKRLQEAPVPLQQRLDERYEDRRAEMGNFPPLRQL